MLVKATIPVCGNYSKFVLLSQASLMLLRRPESVKAGLGMCLSPVCPERVKVVCMKFGNLKI